MRPSRPLAQTVSGQARHRLRRSDVPRLRRERTTLIRTVSRPGSDRGGRLPSHIVGLFRGSREPKVSLPRRSRARRPPLPDRLPGQPPLRSGSLVTGRLAAAARKLPHPSAGCETASNQGRQGLSRSGDRCSATAVPRPTGRKKVYTYNQGEQRLAPLLFC